MNPKKLLLKTIFLSLVFTAILPFTVMADYNFGEYRRVSGVVIEAGTKEPLIGATVYVAELKAGTATDLDGKFLLKLPEGKFTVTVTYIGYKSVTQSIMVKADMGITIVLEKDSKTIDDVVVMAKRNDENVTRNEMSVEKLKIQEINSIPALMGEVDVIKAIQLLPGVQPIAEGGSGFSVRGGNIDQNLILIDEAPVYNASHLMGFFSVFNNDAVDNIELYKGDLPAAYGGRLASLLKVEMAEGSPDGFGMKGGIGTISSRLTVSGPIGRNTTYLLAGRRSYADIFLPFASNEDVRDVTLYFWDLNGKIRHRINNRNVITISGYMGKDEFGPPEFQFGFGNKVTSIAWTHSYSENLVSKLTGFYSNYGYKTSTSASDASTFLWKSNVQDYGLKYDNTVLLDSENTIKFGVSSILHKFNPGIVTGGAESLFGEFKLAENSALEWGFYGSNNQEIGEKLSIKYGLRFSVFQNVGPGTLYYYDNNYNMTDSTNYNRGDVYNVYQGLEPRLGIVYQLNKTSSVKASYSRTRQYVHLASNSTGGTPFDIWIPSNPNIKPQISDQYALGYFRNFWFDQVETSVELYYKNMQNTIDFKDHAQMLLNPYLDGEFRMGSSNSYGAEFFVKVNFEKLSGWVSYTLSKTKRYIPEVNNGVEYVAPYDRPNNFNIVLTYKLTPRLDASLNWVYATGTPMTIPSGKYEMENSQLVFYGKTDRNDYRMPDYHRLDLGMNYILNKNRSQRWQHELNLSIYNAYARHNAWTINFPRNKETGQTEAEMTYLFSIIPSITYNFKF
jgi:hypothetical protein